MSRPLAVLALLASCALREASAQEQPDSATRRPQVKTEYDELTDSTTRSLSAYVIVDTSVTPPDTFAVELTQRWKGRGLTAPVAAVELGLGRTRLHGPPAPRRLMTKPTVVFLVDGTRRIRLERTEYVSNAGDVMAFETARYRLSPGDLRLIAACRNLRVWIGDRELWIDPAWRVVVADMVAGQAAPR
jgi:hypothetical protein